MVESLKFICWRKPIKRRSWHCSMEGRIAIDGDCRSSFIQAIAKAVLRSRYKYGRVFKGSSTISYPDELTMELATSRVVGGWALDPFCRVRFSSLFLFCWISSGTRRTGASRSVCEAQVPLIHLGGHEIGYFILIQSRYRVGTVLCGDFRATTWQGDDKIS